MFLTIVLPFSFQKDREGLEDQVRVLTDDKTKLDDTLKSLKKEKSEIDSEIQKLNEKLQEESYGRIVLESEVSEITELFNKEKNDHCDSVKEIERLKLEVGESASKCEELKVELIERNEECNSVAENLETKETELAKMEVMLDESQMEKQDMEKNIESYKEQLTNLQCTMEQQISSLRFQLSSEALKYDENIKVSLSCLMVIRRFFRPILYSI